MELDPALIVGPWGATFILAYLCWRLDKANGEKDAKIRDKDQDIEELRAESTSLLRTYQNRDEEERLWRQSQDRKRLEGSR